MKTQVRKFDILLDFVLYLQTKATLLTFEFNIKQFTNDSL